MLGIAFIVLPALVLCSSEGNIHLLEEEIEEAIKACTHNESDHIKRYSRSNQNTNHYQYPRIDNNKNTNPYNHERRNSSDMIIPNNVTTLTSNDLFGYGDQYENDNFNNTGKSNGNFYDTNNNTFKRRNKRNEHLNNNEDDKCLSQCVFANLHVVDTRGIPRETELWNKIQAAVTSQQSRVLLQDQINSCFQELQNESEDDGCSYSSKLERCLMLSLNDRIKGSNARKQS